ncbi:MAG TPA: DUF3341 domain-containing protein [Cytophagales bacterium]|jgi:hypothetical protein|nr:DUF3341 domain-containing protein [Cytophagales bacterium]
MEAGKNYIVGVFSDEDVLMKAIKHIRSNDVKIDEVYSPFPVHGIDEALGYKRSRLSIVAFLFGLTGTTLALTMQFWMMGVDWPMIIGGKNFAALPTFIPITFELTVLLSALGMVATFFLVSNLKPYKKPRIFDVRITNDKHVVAVDMAKNPLDKSAIESVLKGSGAEEVNEKVFE